MGLPANMPIQGNLDPLALRIGGNLLRGAVQSVLDSASGPHIFNLGHGVTPDVKIKNVQAVIDHVRTGEGDYV
jgi:uroporphyrinogen decarboxylase